MPLKLTDEFKNAINNALADRAPILLAAVQEDGYPYMGYRGSTQVHSDDQLGIWLRNLEGHTASAMEKNNRVALFYRNTETRLSFQIQGSARLVEDDETKRRIYDAAPQVEQNADKDFKGIGMIVDIDRVIQRGQVVLARDESEVTAEPTGPQPAPAPAAAR
jgi:general stress protein 26